MIEIAGESPISSATWATPQSIWLKTFGCSHNTSDAEFMAGQLHEYGYILLGDEERERAELWLINSCTVKGPSRSTSSDSSLDSSSPESPGPSSPELIASPRAAKRA